MTKVNLRRVLLVAFGGTIGTAARLGLGLAIPDQGGFPVAVLVANILGAFLIGVVAARLAASTDLRLLLGTGVLGGFTTYSALAVQTDALLRGGQAATAFTYAAGTVALGLAASLAGISLARRSLAQ